MSGNREEKVSLNQEQLDRAKAEARRYLEYSTYVLCLALGVDPNTASSEMGIPVATSHPEYYSYDCLIRFLSRLENL